MKVEIKGRYLSGSIDAIPSKSYVHRILICKYLSGEQPTFSDYSSNDMKATVNCLNALINGKSLLDCGESGSTLRFILPLIGVIGGEYTLVGGGKLMQRPNDALFETFKAHGVTAIQEDKIVLKGKLTAGEYRIRGDISSQYVSGLLMALPILDGDSKIVLSTPLVSAPYVDITLEVLKGFGIDIQKTDYGYKIRGGQTYSKSQMLPEGDWSNAAFFLVAGAINGEITVNGLNPNSVQADKFIYDVIKFAGVKTKWKGNSLTVYKSDIKSFAFDAENCPDIVPISAVLASFADGVSVIKNVERLKIKESDRIATTCETLKAFGINAEYKDKNLYVYGSKPKKGQVDSYNDHRIAMSASVMASGIDGSSFITDAGAINKSYPTFYKDLQSVGGVVSEL